MITSEDVAAAFDEVAPRYDLMVALNPGYHAHLRAAADALMEWLPRCKIASSMRPAPSVRSESSMHPGMSMRPQTSVRPESSMCPQTSVRPEPVEGRQRQLRILDLGCGSGASTGAVLRAVQAAGLRALIVGVDASPAMLEEARAKQWPAGVRFEVGQAERIASSRDSWGLGDHIDGAFAAYLFRNVADRDAVLAGLFGLLAEGGVLVVQEYSVAGGGRSAHAVWTAVCWLVIIPLGWLTSRRTRLFRYLWRSVLSFDSIQTFVDRLYGAGFVDVEVATVSGWQRGILHSFRARKRSVAS
jgi:ubiquinone/menaquinone biosynthesis C-methylase UbiE